MANREAVLRNIKVGDIFHAESPNGASMPCQALTITDKTIEAQRMFMRDEILRFDRTTGLERGNRGAPSKTVIPLPDDIRDVLLKRDRLDRTGHGPEDAKLSELEKRALIFIQHHFRNNQI